MYVCMCVCMHIKKIYTRIHHAHTHKPTYRYAPKAICDDVQLWMQGKILCTYVCVYEYAYIYIYVYVCMYVCI